MANSTRSLACASTAGPGNPTTHGGGQGEPLARLSVSLPRDLRRRFKGKTAMEGVTMTDVIIDAVRRYMGE